MNSRSTASASRTLSHKGGVPQDGARLWCPLLTPFDSSGEIDHMRLRRHMDFLRPAVDGFLVPGSTGDGWTLSQEQTQALLATVVEEAVESGVGLLIGILKPDRDGMVDALMRTSAWLRQRAGTEDTMAALHSASVQGFAYCAPHGQDRSQQDIVDVMDSLLATGLPATLYQLPQITGNEVAPQTVRSLAARHPNLRMFKDTSGTDRVANAGVDDLYLMRGAEGGYSRQLKLAGGRYDGFLLSSANGLGPQLAELIDHLRQGRRAQADALSTRLEAVVSTVFSAAAALPYGNVFTNANKAIDHFMAFGPDPRRVAAPRLFCGRHLPADLLATTGEALARHGLMPAQGYLHS